MGAINLQVITENDLISSDVTYDIDGTVLHTMRHVEVTKGCEATFFTRPGADKPHEINLSIGGVDCECVYSEELDDAINRIETISAVEMFGIINKYLWCEE